ncbi:LuxR C-terminal-related transcriptional regulator [Myroides sp. N17-2]|uniref:LuxR C-terminal-related transcriptional regulator n=1 Tax=Myroides sp. N17-2 TaxID=2030799 RepID=UPI000EFA8CFD|nr:LuxR C-terminal-related transcriptional regulator [Myroides sp. N17-2]
MKAIHCRKKWSILTILITLFLLSSVTNCLGQTNNDQFENTINQLHFEALDNDSKTQLAKDNEGNTWLKITVPQDLLNKPLILQFPTIHVNNYNIYVKQKGLWGKTSINTDLQGGKISPQYQENHFITDHEIIYFKSKSPYVHYGKFILVERGEHRSIMLNTIIKIEVFYSLFLLSIAVIFALYSLFKEKVILIYCIYIISVFFIYLIEDGALYFLCNKKCNELLVLAILMPISCLIFSVFIYYFLDIQKLPAKLKYFYLFQVLLYVVLGILFYQTNNPQYFIIIVNTTLVSTLITLALVSKYFKEDISVRYITFSFSVIALTSMTYYLSIFPGNYYLSFVEKDKMRIIYSIAFTLASYSLWIKAKKLKTDHENLRTELEHLKAKQAKKTYDDLKQKEATPILFPEQREIIPTDTNKALSDKKEEISYKDILREKYFCTDREIDVILGIWDGLSNQEIAEKLSISLSTTKHHVSNAYIKLDVKSRSQALILKDTLV